MRQEMPPGVQGTSDRPALPAELVGTGVVAIARAPSFRHIPAAAHAAVEVGFRCLEVTLTMPDAVSAIAFLVQDFGPDACIGAGTVLTAAQARSCIDAGAKFLVAPSTVPEVVAVAVAAGVPCLPGAFTASEIVTAWESGAAAVKLFPASLGGVRYLRDLRAPLPFVPLIPVGGVNVEDVPGYFAAGAVAVGVGSPLFGNSLADGRLGELTKRAEKLYEAVQIARDRRGNR